MPADIARAVYSKNRVFYDKILKRRDLKEAKENVKASVLLISGCQDNQPDADGNFNGLFTSNLLKVWKDGSFEGNYKKFYSSILKRMPQTQSPNYFIVGKKRCEILGSKTIYDMSRLTYIVIILFNIRHLVH